MISRTRLRASRGLVWKVFVFEGSTDLIRKERKLFQLQMNIDIFMNIMEFIALQDDHYMYYLYYLYLKQLKNIQ